MMFKYYLLPLMFLIILSPAFSALSTDKQSYDKGESMTITGSSYAPGQIINLRLFSDINELLSTSLIADSLGSFTYNYNITNFSPSGSINITDGSLINTVSFAQTRNSSYYLITFLSPAPRSYERTESLNVRINLTSAGEIITGAEIKSFDAYGKLINLIEEGEGVYSFNYLIPPDAPLKSRQITVLAGKDSYGGERSVSITVNTATLSINLLEPKLSTYDVGSNLPIKFTVAYPNGSLFSPSIELSVSDSIITASRIGDEFIAEYQVKPSDDGIINLMINVNDEFGNTGSLTVKLTITGLLNYLLMSNLWWILIVTACVIIAVFFTQYKVAKASNLKSLKKRKDKLINKKKDAQNDYYVSKTIDKETYDNLISEIDEEASSINEKINSLKGKK